GCCGHPSTIISFKQIEFFGHLPDYFPHVGTRRLSPSKKLSRTVTLRMGFSPSVPSGFRTTAKRFPSGAKSYVGIEPMASECISDHTWGLPGTKESPFDV